MSVSPCSYDFFSYLYAAEICRVRRNLKMLEVIFVQGPNKRYRADNNYRSFQRNETFFNNVIIPGLTLLPSIGSFSWKSRDNLDLNSLSAINKFPRGYTLNEPVPEYLSHELVAAKVRGDKHVSIKAPEFAKKMVDDFLTTQIGSSPFITLTVRELDRGDINKTRSIDRDRWYKVLETVRGFGIKPIIVRDTAMAFDQPMFDNCIEAPVASIHLPFRIALYERALMNFTRNNGPAAMLIYGNSHSIFFNEFDESFKSTSEEWFAYNYGMVKGSQFPMTTTRTNYIWEPEDSAQIAVTIENLLKSPKKQVKLHGFLNKANASMSYQTALRHLLKCLKSETLSEDEDLFLGLKKINKDYKLGSDIEDYSIKKFEDYIRNS